MRLVDAAIDYNNGHLYILQDRQTRLTENFLYFNTWTEQVLIEQSYEITANCEIDVNCYASQVAETAA